MRTKKSFKVRCFHVLGSCFFFFNFKLNCTESYVSLCREVTVVERLKQESMYGRYAKKWPLQRGGRCGEVAVVERWPLWRGGRCGEVAAVERWPL